MMKKHLISGISALLISVAFTNAQSTTTYETPAPQGAALVSAGNSYTVPAGMVARLDQVIYDPYKYFEATSGVGSEMTFVFCGKKVKGTPYTRVLSINGQLMYFSDGSIPAATTTVQNNRLPMYLPEGTVICVPEGHQTIGASLLLYSTAR